MDSPSGWQRDTVQRLLLHRADPAVVAPLRALVKQTTHAKARVQAIWTLADLGALDETSALAGLKDREAEARQSVIAAVAPVARATGPLGAALLELVDDSDPEVRFQLTLALGDWHDPRAGEALARLARRDGSDRWLRAAVLCSAVPHLATLLAGLVGASAAEPPPAMVEPLLAMAGQLSDRQLLDQVVRSISDPAGQGGHYAAWQFAALSGLLEARSRARKPLDIDLDKPLARLWGTCRHLVTDDAAAEGERIAAVQLLGRTASQFPADRDLLLSILRPQVSIGLQQASIAALGRGSDPKLAELLLRDWKRRTPRVRGEILDTLLSRGSWTGALLSALEDGCVPSGEIDAARRERLLKRRDAALRSRAEAVFAQKSQTRQSVVEAYRKALEIKGDRAAGTAVFKKLCATCHRLGGDGVDVGPDLAALTDKSPEALLIAILDPNRAFEAKYAGFAIATTDGRVVSGLLASESATAVNLLRQEGKTDVLLRSDIEEMSSSGQSLMPEGLERDLSQRDLADLIAFLSTTGPAR
jgi:putative heme-binding domain-containing protein